MVNFKINDSAFFYAVPVLALGKGLAFSGIVASRLITPLSTAGIFPAFIFGLFQSALGNTIYLLAKQHYQGKLDCSFPNKTERFKYLALSHLASSAIIGGLALGALKTGLIATAALNPVNIVALGVIGTLIAMASSLRPL